jgi:peptide/nickel transport system permease protein
VFVLWAAFTVSFTVLYLLPSDPVSIMAAGGGDS